MLSEEELERNVQGIRDILKRLLSGADGAAGHAPAILNNLVWECTLATNSPCSTISQACSCMHAHHTEAASCSQHVNVALYGTCPHIC